LFGIVFIAGDWKEDLLFRVVTLESQQPSAGFVSEISGPNVVKTENYTCQNSG